MSEEYKNPMRVYWDSIDKPYQMGAQKHRLYMLDLLRDKGAKSLLDVGCGTGPIYDLVVNNEEERWDNITKYKGTDYSEDMIRSCKEQFPYGDFEVQDGRDLMENDETWECVLLLHALDHVKEYQQVIKEAARVSSKYVCIVLWREFAHEGVAINDRNMMGKEEGQEPWEDTYLMQFSTESLETEFKKNGLVIEAVAEGEQLNSGQSRWNFLYLLRKKDTL